MTTPTDTTPPDNTHDSDAAWTLERMQRAGNLATRWMRGEPLADLIHDTAISAARAEADVRAFLRYTIGGIEFKAEARRLRAILKVMSEAHLGDGVLIELETIETASNIMDPKGTRRTLTNFVVCSATLDERSTTLAVLEPLKEELAKIGVTMGEMRITGTEAEGG
jgi:hypothetical protein